MTVLTLLLALIGFLLLSALGFVRFIATLCFLSAFAAVIISLAVAVAARVNGDAGEGKTALIVFMVSAAVVYIIPWLFEVGAKRRAKRDAKIIAEQDAARARLVEIWRQEDEEYAKTMTTPAPSSNANPTRQGI